MANPYKLPKTKKLLGKWAIEAKQPNTKGTRLTRTCGDDALVWCLTFIMPKKEGGRKLATRYNHNGEIKRTD